MIARARAPAALFGFGTHSAHSEKSVSNSHPKIGRTKTAAGSATTAHT